MANAYGLQTLRHLLWEMPPTPAQFRGLLWKLPQLGNQKSGKFCGRGVQHILWKKRKSGGREDIYWETACHIFLSTKFQTSRLKIQTTCMPASELGLLPIQFQSITLLVQPTKNRCSKFTFDSTFWQTDNCNRCYFSRRWNCPWTWNQERRVHSNNFASWRLPFDKFLP